MTQLQVPLIIRGKVIDDYELEFGGRHGGVRFRTPDVAKYIDQLTLALPSRMADLYDLSFAQIASFLHELGEHLVLERNEHMQQAFALSCATSGLSESILRSRYHSMPKAFSREAVRSAAELSCGINFLEGWVEQTGSRTPGVKGYVRAFGARAVHVIAGNLPDVAALTVLRNAITRSDCIIKTPSNDPLTAAAIARTMIDMAPDHPITRHCSVAYWKGGNEQIEEAIYHPQKIEKVIAWGGFASIKHITKYLQPGIDLITLDPKLSGTIVGREAFESEETMQLVANRLALDIGTFNQEGCVNARVIHVQSGTDEEGIKRCTRLAELTFAAIQALPPALSTPHKDFDAELRDELQAISLLDFDYRVFGGRSNEGAIVVSLESEPVDFSRILACRVANLVPIDDVETAVKSVSSYTQTIGIYPASLRLRLRDRLAFHGAQRLVALGGAAILHAGTERQDGIETMRRMCKWITDESGEPEEIVRLYEQAEIEAAEGQKQSEPAM